MPGRKRRRTHIEGETTLDLKRFNRHIRVPTESACATIILR